MIRKTILGLAAGAALVTVALAPTAASAHYYGYKSYGYGYKSYGYNHGYNSYRSYEPTYTYSYKPYGYYKSYRYGY